MSDYPLTNGGAKPARPLRTALIVAVIAFLAGLIAMGWALKTWGGGTYFGRPTLLSAAPEALSALDSTSIGNGTATNTLQGLTAPAQTEQLGLRVRDLEDRLARISVSAQAASGNAARAEGLLIAFAARRALDRGVALGYLEGQLRDRFGQTQPRAVATVINTSRQPITLEELQIALDDLGPELAASGSSQNWWDGMKRELSELIVVRKAGTPSPLPVERLRRAKRRLEGGQVDAALAEIARMPGRDKAANWMAAARRYIEARRALDTIETAAILEPRISAAIAPPTPTPPMASASAAASAEP